VAYKENLGTLCETRPATNLPAGMSAFDVNELFASCMPRLAKAARQMTRNSQDCDDILQDSLLAAFRNLGQFQGRSKFSTWVYSIIRNTARMYVRRANSRPLQSIELERSDKDNSIPEEAFVDSGPSPEESSAQNERSRVLESALRNLPPEYESAIRICDMKGLSGKDAAESLGVSITALKTRLHRARRLVACRIRKSHLSPANSLPREERMDHRPAAQPEFGHDLESPQSRRLSHRERHRVRSAMRRRKRTEAPADPTVACRTSRRRITPAARETAAPVVREEAWPRRGPNILGPGGTPMPIPPMLPLLEVGKSLEGRSS
jgi:RNA polymerase sigma-70 factor, ECF subfamily